MRFIVLVVLMIISVNNMFAQQWPRIGNDLVGDAHADFFGSGISLSENGKIMAVCSPRNNFNGTEAGDVKVYELQNGGWVKIGNSILGEREYDWFGSGLSLSANGYRIAIGASLPSGFQFPFNPGKCYVKVYELDNGNWVQIGDSISSVKRGDESSNVVLSADGKVIAIGGYNNDNNGSNSGHVRLFEENGGSWVPLGLEITGEYSGDMAGVSLDLSENGKRVAIASINNDDNGNSAGHVRIFELVNNSWIQMGNSILGDTTGVMLGHVSLSNNGTRVAVGSTEDKLYNGFLGYTKVFEYDGNDWYQIGATIESLFPREDGGKNITISGDGSRLAISSYRVLNDTTPSYVRVFEFNGNDWKQIDIDLYSDNTTENFGTGLSLSGDGFTLAVGASADYSGLISNYPGIVRVYQVRNVINSVSESAASNNMIAIGPNPLSDVLEINSAFEAYQVLIYNALGQLHWSKKINELGKLKIDTRDWNTGVYYLSIRSKAEFVLDKKLLKLN